MKIALVAVFLAAVPSPLSAQSPFDGNWVLNQQKSDFTGESMTIEDAGDGAITFVNPNFTYTVKTDGTKTDTPGGATVAIQKQGEDSYHQTLWRKGKELSQSDWKLSDEGKTLTIHEFGTRPDGEKFDDTSTYARASGGTSLGGEWKTTSVKMGSPQTFAITIGADDQMTWDIPAMKATWKGKTNGTEAPAVGPTVPESLTLAVTRSSPRSLSMIEKLKGKTLYTATYTVSEDGKTMTVAGKNAKGETIREVWDKKPES
jgi:hypothetical protein